jgi:RNA polymerase sigma factor (TIGR02999 family)
MFSLEDPSKLPGGARTAPVDRPIGQLIQTAEAGDGTAADQLFAALYHELHAIAERELHRGGAELTLGTTTLLHEAYLNIAGREGVQFANRPQFFAYAARAMRGLMIDYARRRQAKKRGGEFHITSSGAAGAAEIGALPKELEQLGAALDTLAEADPALAQLVDLHFFCGFSFGEVAELRGVSERTVQRDWRKARLLLHRALQES